MTVRVKFLGAAGTVTGSKYLVQSDKYSILVDAGLFQGRREWRERNWNDPETNLKKIDATLLTHAHIDHTGILPRYTALGLNSPVHGTASTVALTKLLLMDSGYLQEQEAKYRAKRGKSRHNPPLPLYTVAEAESACSLLRSVNFERRTEILDGVYATWRRMGHILGAASISLEIEGKIITFSGDIGRYNIPILVNPQPVPFGDLLLIESTYGDRLHGESDAKQRLGEIVNRTTERGGAVVIPSFAVGRAQLLLFYLRELKEEGVIPEDLPVIVDSPMAEDATHIYKQHPQDYDEESLGILKDGRQPFSMPAMGFVQSTKESIKLNSVDKPMVLISASGMLSGGRILHHLKHRISDPRNTVLFVGYQPPGGRGHWIQSGAETVRLFGEDFTIRAEIDSLSGLSAHGDQSEMFRWCEESEGSPGLVKIIHGEPDSAATFGEELSKRFGWSTSVAKYLETIEL